MKIPSPGVVFALASVAVGSGPVCGLRFFLFFWLRRPPFKMSHTTLSSFLSLSSFPGYPSGTGSRCVGGEEAMI